jgi:23S rRNA (adenine2503-C2)-methyltransferase
LIPVVCNIDLYYIHSSSFHVASKNFRRPTPEAVEAFRAQLERRHIAVSVRASRGLDQDAACGQLRRRLLTAPAG